jgi:polyphosphate kinase
MTEEPTTAKEVDLAEPEYYLNRELSELAFQRRVLHEAEDERNPLLERVRFLAIVTQNLDEFSMKRIGGLKLQIAAGVTAETADGRTPESQWEAALDALNDLLQRQASIYAEIAAELADEGIRIVDYDELDADEQARLRNHFEASVLPTLTPLTFDPAHPFPFISNLSLSLAVLTNDAGEDDLTFSRVKVPENRRRLVSLDDGRFALLEDVIGANLDLLFPSVEVVDWAPFRVTRNAEVRRNEEVAEDLVNRAREVLRQRQFATVVRLEVASDIQGRARAVVLQQLELDESEVVELDAPPELRPLMSPFELARPDLTPPSWTP